METLDRPKLRGARPLALAIVLTVAALFAASAAPAASSHDPSVPAGLLEKAKKRPGDTFRVIVEAQESKSQAELSSELATVSAAPQRKLESIRGAALAVTGRQLLELSTNPAFSAIAQDVPVTVTGNGYSTTQSWPFAIGAPTAWSAAAAASSKLDDPPAIAIVDTGVDPSRPDFKGRVVAQVDLATSTPDSPRDGNGHGTFVAGIAAGSASGYAGVAPTAPIVSVDVADDNGHAYTSDVIAGADWILEHKDDYDIRVANFSLQGSVESSIRFDPLDQAAERLWLAGVVVVTGAGNDRTGDAPNGVVHAPANDPFVITVGALDLQGTTGPSDDVAAPWSAYGRTPDGFLKPDISAPGRSLIGPVQPGSVLTVERPTSVVAKGYMRLSGTSFSAPAVAGAAAALLAQHPSWTPDQVKGALVQSARRLSAAFVDSVGSGELDVTAAFAVTSPTNPNAPLNRFVVEAPDGSGPVFDQASWTSAASSTASWTSASWTSAAWTSAAWTSASWTSAAWTNASWTDASWTSASWTSVAPVQ